MRVKAKVLDTKITADGQMLAKIQLNGKLPKVGDYVDVKWGSTRSLAQNSLYWLYLTFIIEDGGLKEQGWYSPQAFHDNMKKYFLSEKIMVKGQFKALNEASTTMMSKVEFGEYMDKVDAFVQEKYEIDTSAFWVEYKDTYSLD